MKKKIIGLVSLFVVAMAICTGTAKALTFAENYSKNWSDSIPAGFAENPFVAVAVTSDGYVAVGSSSIADGPWGTASTQAGIIVKYNSAGTVVWAKNNEGITYTDVVVVSDGYVVVGYSSSNAVIIKYNSSNGDIVWSYTAGGAGSFNKYTGIATTSDGFVVVGHSTSGGRAAMIKYNLSGIVDETITVENSTTKEYYSVIRSGNFIIAVGYSTGGSAIIDKYDMDGTITWQKSTGSSTSKYNSVIATSGGYVAVGTSNSNGPWGNISGGTDGIIVKYDLDGEIDWSENSGRSVNNVYNSVTEVNNGYIAVGYTDYATTSGTDGLIVKYNLDGTIVYTSHIGESGNNNYYNGVVATSDGFVVVGSFYITNEDPICHDTYIARYTNISGNPEEPCDSNSQCCTGDTYPSNPNCPSGNPNDPNDPNNPGNNENNITNPKTADLPIIIICFIGLIGLGFGIYKLNRARYDY